jgi:hypothetical protein
MASLNANCYPGYRSTCLAMIRLDSKEVKHKDYDAEVILMINPQEEQLH